jgi:hypothetical protein
MTMTLLSADRMMSKQTAISPVLLSRLTYFLRSRVVAVGVVVFPMIVHAQVVSLSIPFSGPRNAWIRSTPAHALINLGHEDSRTASRATSVAKAHFPKDSLRHVAEQRAQQWLSTLHQAPVKGLQLDPYGMIAVSAHQDAVAQQQIATRLATPGLSVADRGYTLQWAVSAFASVDYPNRIPVAERYLTQLDALGPDAAFWQLQARLPLIEVYYRLGRGTDVIRLGLHAFSLVDRVPFELRGAAVYNPGIAFSYAAVVDALSGQPDGRAKIRAMNEQLEAGTTAPAAYVARDSFFSYIAERYHGEIHAQVVMSERVGQQGTPLVANYWVNRGATRDSQTVAVNDGTIRVIEIGSYTCGPCVAAVFGLDRLHQRHPAVEFNFMTFGGSTWGNRIVEPKVAADRLAEQFLQKWKVTIPIGIAMPTKLVPTEDGGEAAEISTPTWHADNYPQSSKPTIYILDGKGMIRRVLGGYSRDLDEHIAATIEFLQREAASANPQA